MEITFGKKQIYLLISFINQDNPDELIMQFLLPLLDEHEKALMVGDVDRCIQFTYPAKRHLVNNLRRCYRSAYYKIPHCIKNIIIEIALMVEGEEFSSYKICIAARNKPENFALLINNLIGLNNDYYSIVRSNNKKRENYSLEPNQRFVITIRNEVLKSVIKHSNRESFHETGGVFLGKVLSSMNLVNVIIMGFIQGKYMEHDIASLGFTPQTWAYFWRSIDRNIIYSNDQEWKMVGWYHTHPSYGVFLSDRDLFIHRNYFSQPYHLALVIDPVNNSYGFFNWENDKGEIVQTPSKHIKIIDDEELIQNLEGDKVKLPEIELISEN